MHRVNVAFETIYQMLGNLEKTQHRRKAVVLISNGYDFDPFATTRAANSDPALQHGRPVQRCGADRAPGRAHAAGEPRERDDLHVRSAGPRGGTGYRRTDRAVEWATHLRKTQDSLRVMAEQTGGIAVVNTNNFSKALKQIDAETSDYYMLGYHSTNPDPTSGAE